MAAAAVLVGALGAPIALWAQPAPEAGGERQGRMLMRHKGLGPGAMRGMDGIGLPLRQLNLSDQQREQVRTLMQSHRQEFQAIGERMRVAGRALEEAVNAPTVDEGAIRAASGSLAEVQADGAVLRARVRAEVLTVLTPEQRQRAEELRARVQQKREQRLEQRRQNMQRDRSGVR
jgi:periplasmic protein CpxP/Spy